jgi:hypothetical protein
MAGLNIGPNNGFINVNISKKREAGANAADKPPVNVLTGKPEGPSTDVRKFR